MDERESADNLDRFLDGLATGVEGDDRALDPDIARIARRYRALGRSSAPVGARERVRQRLDNAGISAGVDSPLVLLSRQAVSLNGRPHEADAGEDRRNFPENRRGRAMLELAAAVLLIVFLGGSALGGGQSLTRFR